MGHHVIYSEGEPRNSVCGEYRHGRGFPPLVRQYFPDQIPEKIRLPGDQNPECSHCEAQNREQRFKRGFKCERLEQIVVCEKNEEAP